MTDAILQYDTADNRNNGLITKIWGGPGWIFGHSVTFGYPIEPTDEQKSTYKNYFILFGSVLPCRYCRESYVKFISEGETKLIDDVMESRKTLTKWFYDVHEAVNNKLGIDYGVTYEDLVNKYESFRAKCTPAKVQDPKPQGCVAPLDYKAYSYKRINQYDCPIFNIDLTKPFIRIAKMRGLNPKLFGFYKLIKKAEGNFSKVKKTEEWTIRNYYCRKKIIKMRESAIPSLETEGPWKDTPTIDELKLLVHLSSNLNKTELSNCIRNLLSNITYLCEIK
jgi:hypothetical protein